MSTILLECATVPNGGWGSMVAELRPASPPGSTPIRLHVLNAGEDPGIRVDLGEAAWTFPAGPPYTGKDRVGRANEHWRAILAVLQRRAATTRDPLTVNPDEGVPWAYVVQVLSIACASGPTIVSLPASDTQLEVRLDEGGSDAATALLRVARGDSYGLTAPTWVTVGLLSGGVIGALLFLVRSRRRTGARA